MDDLLFFVPRDPLGPQPQPDTEPGSKFFVVRKHGDAKHKLPRRGDLSINWRDTYFLNIITNHLKYTLIMEVSFRKHARPSASPQMTESKKQRVETFVYASPTQVRMDRKEEEVTETYPTIFFAVNDFQEVLQDLTVAEEGELVCVKLLATLPESSTTSLHLSSLKKVGFGKKGEPITIFSGAVGYEVVRQAFAVEARKLNSPSTIRWLTRSQNKGNQQVFLNMKGPAGKGKAQMAVTPVLDPSNTTTNLPPQNEGNEGRGNSWMNLGLNIPLGAVRKFLPASSAATAGTDLPARFRCSLTSILLPWTSIIDDVYKTNISSAS